MEELKTNLIKSLLSTLTYDDMTPEQEKLVVEYETEIWKPKVAELKGKIPIEDIKETIHDWWMDYEIADGTEDNLLTYAEE